VCWVSGRLFGTSGIRGLISDKLTPPVVAKVALSFASFLQNHGKVGIARDARLGSSIIEAIFANSLIAGGVDVIDYGLTSTPALLHAIKKRGLKGGVAITGSHTPPEIHGILLFKSNTAELFRGEEEVIEKVFFDETFKVVDYTKVGRIEEEEPYEPYIANILEKFGSGSFKGRKIVLDAGHSPAVTVLSKVFKELGLKVSVINGEINGLFPNRPPNPLPEYLENLRQNVLKEDADLGVAIDGDGDRAVFVDEQGNIVLPDYMGALFAKYELVERKGTIVCPVNTSSVINSVVEEYGGKLIYTKIGPPAMAEALLTTSDAIFAFEETGKYIWPANILYGDPAYAVAKALQLIENYGPLSRLLSGFPKFYQEKISIPCPDELKQPLLEEIIKILEGGKDVELILVDGVKLVFRNGDWFLLRPSGTEPVFRCFIESRNK